MVALLETLALVLEEEEGVSVTAKLYVNNNHFNTLTLTNENHR